VSGNKAGVRRKTEVLSAKCSVLREKGARLKAKAAEVKSDAVFGAATKMCCHRARSATIPHWGTHIIAEERFMVFDVGGFNQKVALCF